jgi:hypothetical protein
MILLPLLVKEKVEYYYYFDKWKDSIKIMNQEYRKQVLVFENPFYSSVSWKIKNTRHCFVNICNLVVNDRVNYKPNVSRFIDAGTPSVAKFSKYYYYSSGLNDPTGYK